jgi:uncharacterized protein YecT (DUF1311 family)
MRKIVVISALIGSFVTLIQNGSATEKITTQRIDCNKATTTVELKYCSQLSYQQADKALNQVYRKVVSSISGEQKRLLVSGEQAWIKFRDDNCSFETYGSRDGTGYIIFYNGCLERLTKQRTKDLQNYLSR